MYTIRNTILDEFLNPDGTIVNIKSNVAATDEGRDTLLKIADQLNVNVIGLIENPDAIDWGALRERIRNAATFNWIAAETLKSTFTPETKKVMIQTTDVNQYYELAASEGLGLYKLAPGDTQDIVEDIQVINQLINSSLACNIEISDSNKRIIYKGGVKEDSQTITTLNYRGDRVIEEIKVQTTVNALHPQGRNELYFDTATSQVSSATANEGGQAATHPDKPPVTLPPASRAVRPLPRRK